MISQCVRGELGAPPCVFGVKFPFGEDREGELEVTLCESCPSNARANFSDLGKRLTDDRFSMVNLFR